MAYKKTNWHDHVTEYENRYKEVQNEDGTVTHQKVEGEVIQLGTPMSATNFNHMEEGLLHFSVAFDWLYCITQAQSRAQAERITTLEEQIAALTSAGA